MSRTTSLLNRLSFLCALAVWPVIIGHLVEASGRASSTDGQGGIPRELVGAWGYAASGWDYCTDMDQCPAGAGASTSFIFHRSGRAEYFLYNATLVEGCGPVRSLARKSGRIEVGSGTILFTPSAGAYRSVNECRLDLTGLWSFEAQDLEPVLLHWQLEEGKLRITDPSGEASGAYRRR